MAKFFIERPRFAVVIALVLVLAGAICAISLPIEKYPNVTPPQVRVWTHYSGANAETIANTLGAPLEENINGVDGMIYLTSNCSNSGLYELTVTFAPGTDADMALVRVQNRVTQVSATLPSEVINYGITVESANSDSVGFLALSSPNGTYSESALLNYASDALKKQIQRVPGMGKVQVYGAKYSIRVWLNPTRITALGLSIDDIAGAIRSQNKQAALGSIGAQPSDTSEPLTYSLQAKGRLSTVTDFENIVVRTNADGGVVKLKDVARIELGSESYSFHAMKNNAPTAMIDMAQSSGSNALSIMSGVKKTMEQLEKTMPDDMQLELVYDSTKFVKATIKEILETLILTFLLVVFVCYIFLQDWRITMVPVAAIPVSLLATFAGLSFMHYSINILSLFGIVLVIGTVVDDAIVVAERVQYIMDRDKCGPKAATLQAMKDVSGPMAATTLVFLAIFVPVAFMEGITGKIYRQFAVTISFAVMFSLLIALTLSPAMCANLLREIKPKQHGPLKWFNDGLKHATNIFVSWSKRLAKVSVFGVLGIACIIGICAFIAKTSPTEFLPDEDNGVIFMSVRLPEGASATRTMGLIKSFTDDVMALEGVEKVVGIEGIDFMSGAGENVATFIAPLVHWSERKRSDLQLGAMMGKIRGIAAKYPQAVINVFTPPAINGMGMANGINMQLQSRESNDPAALEQVLYSVLMQLNQAPEVMYAFSSYTANTPHEFLDVDRNKAEMLKVPVGSVFSTLQTYFGSSYINDINIGTQVNKVMAQSDWKYRDKMDKIGNVFVRSTTGAQVPLKSLVTHKTILAPRVVSRYNLYPAAQITVVMKPGYSTGQGIKLIESISAKLPKGYTHEWSGMTYQEQDSKGGLIVLLMVSLIFAYLFLVAQYESFSIPISVILSLPVAILGALLGTKIMGISVSIYVQLGILLLVGLAGKNAILIVEFAKEQHEHGLSLLDAAAAAARERFRSVLMTAFTCVIGVLPMLFASGAGAGSRLAVGSTMFFGMNMATIVGIFFVPALFVFFQSGIEKIFGKKHNAEEHSDEK